MSNRLAIAAAFAVVLWASAASAETPLPCDTPSPGNIGTPLTRNLHTFTGVQDEQININIFKTETPECGRRPDPRLHHRARHPEGLHPARHRHLPRRGHRLLRRHHRHL
jgi:hypothetical protein